MIFLLHRNLLATILRSVQLANFEAERRKGALALKAARKVQAHASGSVKMGRAWCRSAETEDQAEQLHA